MQESCDRELADPDDIDVVVALRAAARRLVRELGLLSDVHQDARMTIAQGHLLIEIERRDGAASVSELAAALLLDKSTVSRTIQTLRDKRWLRLDEDPRDRRRKLVGLTRSGQRALARCHRVSSDQVAAALAQLSAEQRATVMHGISLYASALRRVRAERDHTIRPIASADNRDIATIVRRVSAEFGIAGAGGPTADAELDDMAAAYPGDNRHYFVVEKDRRIVGGAGFRPLPDAEPTICELCKMYLAPDVRGQGLGHILLQHCLEQARVCGFERCYLETTARMRSARALYEKLGFFRTDHRLGDTGHCQCEVQYVKVL